MVSTPKPRQMIGLVRLYAYKAGEFWLVDVPLKNAKKKHLQLNEWGWIVTHSEHV